MELNLGRTARYTQARQLDTVRRHFNQIKLTAKLARYLQVSSATQSLGNLSKVLKLTMSYKSFTKFWGV